MTPPTSSARLTDAQNADGPVLIACQHHHRLRHARPPGHAEGASRRAGRRGNRGARARNWAGPIRLSSCPTIFSNQWRAIGAQGKARLRRLGRAQERASAQSKGIRRRDRGRCVPPTLAPALDRAQGEASDGEARGRHAQTCRKRRWRSSMARLPITIGGSADLTPSNNTKTKNIDRDQRRAISPAAISITASASTAWRRR